MHKPNWKKKREAEFEFLGDPYKGRGGPVSCLLLLAPGGFPPTRLIPAPLPIPPPLSYRLGLGFLGPMLRFAPFFPTLHAHGRF